MRDPSFWWRHGSTAGTLLSPLGAAYGAITGARMRRGGSHAGVPVICVGNFTMGGSGKTPAAIAIARMLKENGETPYFLTRGYGGSERGPVQVRESNIAAEIGDEALLLARTAPTIVSADRPCGARMAADRGASVIVMDDGLQNPSLEKDFSLAVVDGPRGVGNGFVFPAGPLRAPLATQLDRVKALLIAGDAGGSHEIIAGALSRSIAIHYGRLVAEPQAVLALRGKRALAFAGIGRPDKFFATLEQEGIEVAARVSFGDHHRFSSADAARLITQAREQGLQLVTTEKDLARMSGDAAIAELRAKSLALPVRLAFDDENAFAAQIGGLRRR